MNITRDMIPAAVRGRSSATTPKIAISQNGQIRLNKLATLHLLAGTKLAVNEVKEVFLDFSDENRNLTIGLNPASFKLKVGQGLDAKISQGKDKDKLSFSGSMLCGKYLNYDFKASGNHSFELIGKNGSHTYSFVAPEGTLPNVTVKRVKKVKAKTAPANENEKVVVPVTEDIE